jgi:hypothetical protein
MINDFLKILNISDEELDSDNEEFNSEFIGFDFDKIENNISNYLSNKLCEMIVCNRYFDFNKKITELCMKELSRRRLDGDSFDYESYIEKISKELPELKISQDMDIRAILSMAKVK